jgi:hypothetical protein
MATELAAAEEGRVDLGPNSRERRKPERPQNKEERKRDGDPGVDY